MTTQLASIAAFRPEEHSIEECLIEMQKYGHPHVTKNDYGWWSGINVFVTGDGVSFDVKYHGAATPREAVNGVYVRLMEAMAKIKGVD